MPQVFGDEAIGVTQIKKWFSQLKNGRTSGTTDAKQNQGDAVFFDILGTVHHGYAHQKDK